ncbi:MAG: hypothetical protein IJU44_09845 [Kiritimatiellae bacterium]|nr:hypothetical protein [Kiritimatiellia bacterium]
MSFDNASNDFVRGKTMDSDDYDTDLFDQLDDDLYDMILSPASVMARSRRSDWLEYFKRAEIEMVMRIYGYSQEKAKALIAKRLAKKGEKP